MEIKSETSYLTFSNRDSSRACACLRASPVYDYPMRSMAITGKNVCFLAPADWPVNPDPGSVVGSLNIVVTWVMAYVVNLFDSHLFIYTMFDLFDSHLILIYSILVERCLLLLLRSSVIPVMLTSLSISSVRKGGIRKL